MTAARRLRELLAGSSLVRAVAPHDVLAARIAEQAGADLLFLGGFGMAASTLGLPDLGLATMAEMADAVRRMSSRVTVPVIADGDTGHGNLLNVARTVREFERAGAAGILLEDQQFPKRCGHFAGKQVISADEMVTKLEVALAARHDPDFVVIARTDARASEGLDAALARIRRYAETGVPVGFVEAPQSRDELARVAREAPIPQLANMLVGGATPILSADELAAWGFKIMVDPLATLAAAGWAVRQSVRDYLQTGRVDGRPAERLTFAELKQILGLDELLPAQAPAAVARPTDRVWARPGWIEQSQLILDSFRRWLGRELLPRSNDATADAARLFEAPFAVLSHGTESDPRLNYANRRALEIWECELDELLGTPSRLTAEPVEQAERQRLLDTTRRQGYCDRYSGVRITRTGRRFQIHEAIVWNLCDSRDQFRGQAATFELT